jgi:hypothetical protein
MLYTERRHFTADDLLTLPDEVASEASQRPQDLADKARLWLARGVRVVWVVWPRRRALTCGRPATRNRDSWGGATRLTAATSCRVSATRWPRRSGGD